MEFDLPNWSGDITEELQNRNEAVRHELQTETGNRKITATNINFKNGLENFDFSLETLSLILFSL